MDCNEADRIMMKYLEKRIDKNEMEMFMAHIEKCESCREIFETYQEMNEIDVLDIAPIDFEEQVMERLENEEKFARKKIDSFICTTWSLISVILGIGTVGIINSEQITQFLNSEPTLNAYTGMFNGIVNSLIQTRNVIFDVANSITMSADVYLENLKYASLLACFILVMAQYLMYQRGKVQA